MENIDQHCEGVKTGASVPLTTEETQQLKEKLEENYRRALRGEDEDEDDAETEVAALAR